MVGQSAATEDAEAGFRPAPPLSPSAVLGDALWLMSRSPAHKALSLADIDWQVVPPIELKQFRLFRLGPRPFAFVTWAMLTDDVARRMASGGQRLSPGEWRCGDQAWLVDVVAPFGGAEGVVREVSRQIGLCAANIGAGGE